MPMLLFLSSGKASLRETHPKGSGGYGPLLFGQDPEDSCLLPGWPMIHVTEVHGGCPIFHISKGDTSRTVTMPESSCRLHIRLDLLVHLGNRQLLPHCFSSTFLKNISLAMLWATSFTVVSAAPDYMWPGNGLFPWKKIIYRSMKKLIGSFRYN
jgi:hypothetical protein